eukprot:COSAG02_NODE_6533_length_3513_cov_3.082601_6_plen_54_part_01
MANSIDESDPRQKSRARARPPPARAANFWPSARCDGRAQELTLLTRPGIIRAGN